MNLYKYYIRACCPRGFLGKWVVRQMNSDSHSALPQWALPLIDVPSDARVLDVGCGGGANIRRMLQRFPQGTVTGIDISSLALDVAYQLNYEYMMHRSIVLETSVEDMVLGKDTFDLVTAFETVYYWESMSCGLWQIRRVLKPGGTLLIANELDGQFPGHHAIAVKAAKRMHVFTVDELVQALTEFGFVNINVSRDTEHHFICVMGQKEK